MKRRVSKEELKKVSGGIIPIWPAAVYVAKQAFEHSDQIIKGFKKGWNGR